MAAPAALALAPLAAITREFPAYREFYREFPQKRPSAAILMPNFPCDFRALGAEFPTRRSREFSSASREF
jgi:hypothetical protein